MGILGVVEGKVVVEPGLGLLPVGVVLQVDLIARQRPPQHFHEYVFSVSPCPIHADFEPVALQEPGETLISELSELASLVGVEDLGLSFSQRLFQGVDAKVAIQGVWQAPGQHASAMPTRDSAPPGAVRFAGRAGA